MYLKPSYGNPGVRTFIRVASTVAIVSLSLSFLWHTLLFIALVCVVLITMMIIWAD